MSAAQFYGGAPPQTANYPPNQYPPPEPNGNRPGDYSTPPMSQQNSYQGQPGPNQYYEQGYNPNQTQEKGWGQGQQGPPGQDYYQNGQYQGQNGQYNWNAQPGPQGPMNVYQQDERKGSGGAGVGTAAAGAGLGCCACLACEACCCAELCDAAF